MQQPGIGAPERAELERLRQVISTGPTGFVSIDEAGTVLIWNASASRLLGWARDEIVGRPLTATIIPPELRDRHLAGMARYLATGEPAVVGRPVVLPALHRDGHRVEIELTIWPSWVGGERQFYAFLRDMSDQRAAAEQAARQTRVLLTTIEAQRAVTAAARDRDHALRVVAEQALAAFPAAAGAVVELVDGDHLTYVCGAGMLAGHTGLRMPAAGSLSGLAITGRSVVRCADTAVDDRVNREACLRIGLRSMCIAPLHSGDRLIGVVKVASGRPDAFDAVDAHHLELLAASLASTLMYVDDYARNATLLAERTAALQARWAAETRLHQQAAVLAERNTALEVANQLKLDIIGMLGHEIGNPLSAILGYSDLLADELGDGSPSAHAVTVISRQAQRLDDIVREVLAMVSIDAGDIHAVRAEVPLRAAITQALESLGAADVPVTGPDAAVLVNAQHLQQILVNLLTNAAKYAGGATGLRIEPAGATVRLRVEDRGPGVPEEFRPRMFDRLTRADRYAGSVRGTGLGLYIVRSLARANHGEVTHEPHPGGGSVFVVEVEACL